MPEKNRPVGQLSDREYQLQAEFRYAIRRFARFSEEQARLSGITPQQHLLLLTVRGHPAYPRVTIKDVAERLLIRQHSASLLVDRSVTRGLLARHPDPRDGRRVLVTLTEHGQQALDAITWANRRELRSMDVALFGFRDSVLQTLPTPPTGPSEGSAPCP